MTKIEEAYAAVTKDRNERILACKEEIDVVLDKHNCFMYVNDAHAAAVGANDMRADSQPPK